MVKVDKKNRIKGGKNSLPFDIINTVLLVILVVIMVYPIYYVVILSFSDGMDAYQGGIFLWPRKFTLDNYMTAFENKKLLASFVISLLRTVGGTVVSVFFIALLGYALASENLPGRRWITLFFYFTTLFGGGAIPMLLLITDLDLLDNFMVYILPAVYGFTNVLIMRIAFSGIPKELRESAMIDGAGEFRIFFRVSLPLVSSSIATIALFTAVFHWNDWYAGKYYVNNEYLKPAATILQDMITASGGAGTYLPGNTTTTPETLQMAFVVIIMLPILFAYPFAQKYFVKGAIVGSVKE